MSEEKTQTFELDEAAVKSIALEVISGVTPVIQAEVNKAVEEKVANTETATAKDVNAGAAAEIKAVDSIDALPKELFLVRQMRALTTGNDQKLKEFNRAALDSRRKAGYANTTTDADGGYVVVQPEFEAEIEKLMPNYGVAFREATVVTVNSNTIQTNKRGSNVSMFEVTSEGGQKSGTKLTISQDEVSLREFAAISTVTNRLTDDAAIDFWAELSAGFAEARAQVADRMVFTESTVATPGILHLPGTIVEGVGAAITSVTWDDLLTAEGKLPSAVQANLKYFMHRTVWNTLLQVKDSEGRYQLPPFAGFKTPWGRDVVLVDVMPSTTSYGDANEGYIILADLKRTKLYVKRGLDLTIGSEATVHDADGNAINLFEKNMKALRAETRMVHLTKFPEAVAVIGTGTVS